MIHKRLDVQGLRAIAVVAVIAFHAGLPMPGGFTGVDVFFVISGFVIASALQREWSQTQNLNLRRFYFRRFKRLAPALSLVVAFTVIAGLVAMPPLRTYIDVAGLTGIGALFFFANGVIASKTGDYFQPHAADNPLLHTWSLSVEEQFYIVFPTLLLFGLFLERRYKLRGTAFAFIAVIAALSIAAIAIHVSGAPTPRIEKLVGFYSPLPRAWEFACGAFVAFAPRMNGWLSRILSLGGLILLGISFWGISETTQFPGLATIFPVFGSVALILAGSTGESSVAHRILASRPMVLVGDASYSLYLWHWPVIVFGAVLFGPTIWVKTVAAAISFLPAILAYRFVETPIRRYEPSSPRRKMGIILQSSLPTLAACALVLFAVRHGYWSDPIQKFQAAADPFHIGLDRGCGLGYVPQNANDTTCNFVSAGSRPPIYLIGDSNADHHSEAVIVAGEATARPVTIFTKGGCGFIGKSWSNATDLELQDCQTYVQKTLAFLDAASPGAVVLGLSDSGWRGSFAVGDDRKSETSDPAEKFAILDRDLVAAVHRLQKAGHTVTLLMPVPKFIGTEGEPLFDYSKCGAISVWVHKCPPRLKLPKSYMHNSQIGARAAIARAADATGAEVLDMVEVFCPTGWCKNISNDGTLLYRDAGHLSVAAHKIAAPAFVAWANK